jgi:hypothetical protein
MNAKDTRTRGASNSQGPVRNAGWEQRLLDEARTDIWKLQGLA